MTDQETGGDAFHDPIWSAYYQQGLLLVWGVMHHRPVTSYEEDTEVAQLAAQALILGVPEDEISGCIRQLEHDTSPLQLLVQSRTSTTH